MIPSISVCEVQYEPFPYNEYIQHENHLHTHHNSNDTHDILHLLLRMYQIRIDCQSLRSCLKYRYKKYQVCIHTHLVLRDLF